MNITKELLATLNGFDLVRSSGRGRDSFVVSSDLYDQVANVLKAKFECWKMIRSSTDFEDEIYTDLCFVVRSASGKFLGTAVLTDGIHISCSIVFTNKLTEEEFHSFNRDRKGLVLYRKV